MFLYYKHVSNIDDFGCLEDDTGCLKIWQEIWYEIIFDLARIKLNKLMVE